MMSSNLIKIKFYLLFTSKIFLYDHVRPVKPRIVEVIEFAGKMGYKALGLVFCIGLRKEARIVKNPLTRNGFAVVSGDCKIGRLPKERIGVRDDQNARIGGFEPICNPIDQAILHHPSSTEFNILMGLCVGHDSLFLRYAQALVRFSLSRIACWDTIRLSGI